MPERSNPDIEQQYLPEIERSQYDNGNTSAPTLENGQPTEVVQTDFKAAAMAIARPPSLSDGESSGEPNVVGRTASDATTAVDADGGFRRDILRMKGVSTRDFRIASITTPQAVPRFLHDLYVALLAELRRIAPLRMAGLEGRAAWKEESVHIANLNQQLLHDVGRLIENMRAKLRNATEEDITEWEDYFVQIDDFAYASEKAGERLAQGQKRLMEIEWNLVTLEKDLYDRQEKDGFHVDALYERLFAKHNNPEITINTSGVGDTVGASGGKRERLAFPHVPPQLIQPSPQRQQAEPDITTSAAESTSENVRQRRTMDESEFEDSLSTSNPGQSPALLDDTAGIGGAFDIIDHEDANLSDGEQEAGLASRLTSNGFSDDDFNGFTRWLLLGVPWTPRYMTHEDSRLGALSSMAFFKAWLVHNLDSIFSGTFGAPHQQAARDENNVNDLNKYVQNWQFDPKAEATQPTVVVQQLEYSALNAPTATRDRLAEAVRLEDARRAVTEQNLSESNRQDFSTLQHRPPRRKSHSF